MDKVLNYHCSKQEINDLLDTVTMHVAFLYISLLVRAANFIIALNVQYCTV